jgi:hypothetical protein
VRNGGGKLNRWASLMQNSHRNGSVESIKKIIKYLNDAKLDPNVGTSAAFTNVSLSISHSKILVVQLNGLGHAPKVFFCLEKIN